MHTAVSFPAEEEKILKIWRDGDVFKESYRRSLNKPTYTFYDGPPFATGLPHYGHILAGTIKDVCTRFASQSGFCVERRFGWDCHGLPVEHEIDKLHNIKDPKDIEKKGIKWYNDCCRDIVMRYSKEWEVLVERTGRWIDFRNDYKTLYPGFMESVWWVFKNLFDKDFVYHGTKVMPYSTACSTPLSNFEAGQNYKDVQDPAVIVSFPLDEDPDVSLLAWTTTPWTLPSNLGLCVNADADYVKIRDRIRERDFILMEARLSILYTSEKDYTILERMKGLCLNGKSYKPLFQYYAQLKQTRGAFRVMLDSYVTSDSGTGVVHQAPYFGEDDHRVCLREGIISKTTELVCPVDAVGKFMAPVTDFAGLYVKDADSKICQMLKKCNRLVDKRTFSHNYPFCWRSNTPLIYKAVPTWFIRVDDEKFKERLLTNTMQTRWVPQFVQEKRFANWLRAARDWAISRNRYWGTPIPLWTNEDFSEVVCVGSVEELERLSGSPLRRDEDGKINLHRQFVDDIEIPSSVPGNPPLRRVAEVFDCWFESGSMPYAQQHYPFENQAKFEAGFPADFIAEGIDQTRGWFYTLIVVGTALFDTAPFKNLIVNGICLNQ